MWVHEALTEIRMKVYEHLIALSRFVIGFERAKLRDASSTALTFLHESPILSSRLSSRFENEVFLSCELWYSFKILVSYSLLKYVSID